MKRDSIRRSWRTDTMPCGLTAIVALLAIAASACDTADCEAQRDAEIAAANVQLVRRSVDEGYNGRDPEAFDSAYHPGAIVWNNGQLLDDGPILEGFRRDLQDYDRQFSDWRIEVDDMFGTADRVAVRWTFRGRVRPDGREVWRTGNWIGRIENGKIAEVWEATDE
jgi:ketosteroid isomerase-like protein